MSLKIGAMFAGMGGLDIAVESVLDSHVSWVAEFDDGPSRILAHRYPHAPNLRDVTKVDWSAVEPVDIITGGSPCQDLSHAGKRAGMKDGTRSGLWAAMCDAVETIRPSLVIWENVRGALSAEAAAGDVESCEFCMGDPGEPSLRALGRVLGDLAELGYDAGWCGLRAADVGAPHGRWRVFVVAWRQDDAAALTWRQDDAAALLPTPVVNDMGKAYTPVTWDEWTARLKASHGNGNGHGASLSIEALRLLKTPTSQLAVNGGSQHPDKRREGGYGPTLADEVEHLLPTPQAHDAVDGKTAAQVAAMRARTGAGVRNLNEVAANELAGRLLPTPRATDGSKGGPNQRGSSGDLMLPSAVTLMPAPRATRGGSGTETMYRLGAERSNDGRAQGVVLMPTPTSTDHKASGSAAYAKTDTHTVGTTLTDATVRNPAINPDLLPTPSVADVEGGRKARSGARSDELLLNGIAAEQRFGDYAPAIARWEAALGRPAPDPTEPTGKGGAHRLSPRFVEWMIGLPSGWVTDPAIWEGMKPSTARNAQLKALGNGVVPQQAAAAIRHMLVARASSLKEAA